MLLRRGPDPHGADVFDTEDTDGLPRLAQGGVQQADDAEGLQITDAKGLGLRHVLSIVSGEHPLIQHGREIGWMILGEHFEARHIGADLGVAQHLAVDPVVVIGKTPQTDALHLQVLGAAVDDQPQTRFNIPLPKGVFLQQLDVGVVQRSVMAWRFTHRPGRQDS